LFVLDVVEFLLLDVTVWFDLCRLEMVQEPEIVFFRETPGHDCAVDEEEDVALFAGGEGGVGDVAGDVDAVFGEGGEGVVAVVPQDGAEFEETEGFGDAVSSNRLGFGLCTLIGRTAGGDLLDYSFEDFPGETCVRSYSSETFLGSTLLRTGIVLLS
jgi:hypothetical protein